MKTTHLITSLTVLAASLASCNATRSFRFHEMGPTPPLLESNSGSVSAETRESVSIAAQVAVGSDKYNPVPLGKDNEIAFVCDTGRSLDILKVNDGAASSREHYIIAGSPAADEKAPCIDKNNGLYYMSQRGRDTEIVSIGSRGSDRNPAKLIQSDRDANWPDWNSKGDSIVYSRIGRSGDYELHILTTKDDKRVPSSLGPGQRARWHPTRNAVVYTVSRHGSWDIYEYDRNDGGERALIEAPFDVFDPDYSPDGKALVYTSNESGNSEVMIKAIDESKSVNLTAHGARDCQPVFSPSGTHVYFASDREGAWGIFKVEVPAKYREEVGGTSPSDRP